jgi:hypothetical protein
MMRRRAFFVGSPVVYAVTVYLALAGAQTRGESVEVLILVIALSVAAGVVAWRFAARLEAARAQAERGGQELALVGQLSATLSGPLTPQQVATSSRPGSPVSSRPPWWRASSSTRRPRNRSGSRRVSGGALPPVMRTRLIGEHTSFVIDDTVAIRGSSAASRR